LTSITTHRRPPTMQSFILIRRRGWSGRIASLPLFGCLSSSFFLSFLPFLFLPARRSKRCPCYNNVSGWLGGWVGVRHMPVLYQNGKTYLKTFSTFGKPHHSSFLRPLRRYTISRGTPSAGALNTRGWENWRFSSIFDG